MPTRLLLKFVTPSAPSFLIESASIASSGMSITALTDTALPFVDMNSVLVEL